MRTARLVCVAALLLVGGAFAADDRPQPVELLKPREGYSFEDVAISPDGRYAAFRLGSEIGLADLRSAKLLRVINAPSRSARHVTGLAFTGPDGKLLVARHERDQVRTWTTRSGAWKGTLSPTWDARKSLETVGARVFASSPTRSEVALAYWERHLDLLDPTFPKRRQEFEIGDEWIPQAVAFSPDGGRVAVVASSYDDMTRVGVYTRAEDGTWSRTARFEDEAPGDADPLATRRVQIWEYVAVSDDGATVIAAGAHVDGRNEIPKRHVLRAWNVEDGKRRWNDEGDRNWLAVLLAPGSNGVLVGASSWVAFLDPLTGRVRRALAPHPDGHDAFALDGTGERVYAVTNHIASGMLIAWDVPAADSPR